MPFANGPIDRDAPVSEESSTARVVNAEPVETCRWYFVAPVEVPQVRVSVVGWEVAALDGEESGGTDGTVTMGT